jgi:hypothetical protein
MTSAAIASLIQDDMSAMHDIRISAYVGSLLITPPRHLLLGWEYGASEEAFEGFLALDHSKSGTAIANCQKGFGPATPWGLISTRHRLPPSMGASDGWFPRFLDAFFESMASTDLKIWRVRERKPGKEPTWISDELSWDEAWNRVISLRGAAPDCRYDCEHAITY